VTVVHSPPNRVEADWIAVRPRSRQRRRAGARSRRGQAELGWTFGLTLISWEKTMIRHGHYDQLFIGGDWVEPASTERIDVISPVTEKPVASVPAGPAVDVDRAVVAARAASDGGWATSPLAERVDALHRLRERLSTSGEEMAQLMTEEMGCPITQARNIQVVASVDIVDSCFGLNGAVSTSNLEHGLEVAARIRTGTVELDGSPSGQSAPMGGVKASGIGRENGPEGLDVCVEPKAIGLPPALAGILT